jgi:pantoate--beta-alanine ligase
MQIIYTIKELKSFLKQKTDIGFIPTMGNLHQGHISLVEKAKSINKTVVVSIFINPKQFGKNEDLEIYPRSEEKDIEKLKEHNVDVVFIPKKEEIYPNDDFKISFNIAKLTDTYCGVTRPMFYSGIINILLIFINIIKPQKIFMGEKDWQQFFIIKKVCEILFLDTEIISVPTIRNDKNLALSSRNFYLSPTEKILASSLHKSLKSAKINILQRKESVQNIIKNSICYLEDKGFKVEYFVLVNKKNMQPVKNINKKNESDLLLLVATYLNNVRLIDNMEIR